MSEREIFYVVALALLCGYGWGYGFGLRRANKDYKPHIDRACEDYRHAAHMIEKMRNRLRAARIIELKKRPVPQGNATPVTSQVVQQTEAMGDHYIVQQANTPICPK